MDLSRHAEPGRSRDLVIGSFDRERTLANDPIVTISRVLDLCLSWQATLSETERLRLLGVVDPFDADTPGASLVDRVEDLIALPEAFKLALNYYSAASAKRGNQLSLR